MFAIVKKNGVILKWQMIILSLFSSYLNMQSYSQTIHFENNESVYYATMHGYCNTWKLKSLSARRRSLVYIYALTFWSPWNTYSILFVSK